MKWRKLHPWGVYYAEAVAIQERLRKRLILRTPGRKPQLIAGADVSYARKSDVFYAGVVVLRADDMTLVESAHAVRRVSFPYIPGLLSFREAPPLLAAFEAIKSQPDVIVFDGQGTAHPRGFGLASHMGLLLDAPSVGCAKTRLVGRHDAVPAQEGSWVKLQHQGRTIGAVVRTRERVKPVYVSPGHRMGLPGAVRVVLDSCRGYRLPEPVRRAHILVNEIRSRAVEKAGTP